tara:strand:- start:114 stop:662 length:549 start_codon:yes stop_codon:yes gene_type:complete
MKLILEGWREYLSELSLGEPAKGTGGLQPYAAFVLEDNSKLLQYAPKGGFVIEGQPVPKWKVYAHHMTIITPKDMKHGRLPARWLDYGHDPEDPACIRVVGIAQNEQVIAVRVSLDGLPMPMKIPGLPHITIATAIDPSRTKDPKYPKYYPPALSHKFVEEDFQPIPTGPFKVCGKVEEVIR